MAPREEPAAEAAPRESPADRGNVNEIIWTLDWRRQRTQYVSPAYETIFGRSRESLYGDRSTWSDAVHPDDRPRVTAMLRRAGERGQAGAEEYRIQRPDGTTRWIRDRAIPILDADGRVDRVVGVAEDITERKRTERSLVAAEGKYRDLVQNAADMFYSLDVDGNFTFVSDSLCANLGYSPPELLGRWARVIIAEEDHEKTAAAFSARLRGEAVPPYEFSIKKRNGDRLRVELASTPIRDPEGRIVGTQAILRDVIARHRAEAAVRESEARFRQLAESIREVFWLTSWPERDVLYVSPAYETVWGRQRETLYARPGSWTEFLHPDDAERVLAAKASDVEGGTYDEEYRIVRGDGTVRWIHDRAFPIRDAEGRVYRVAGIAEDVTERKRVVQALRDSEQRMRAAAEHVPGVVFTYDEAPNRPRAAVYLGPGLKELIGPEAEARVADDFDDLFALVHPADRGPVAEAARTAVEQGRIADFECRIKTDSGAYKWVRTIARGLHQEGAVIRWHVVMIDVTESRRAAQVLRSIAEATSSVTGAEFFITLARTLSEVFDVRHVVVAEHLDAPVTRVRTLAYWLHDRLVPNIEYDVRGTPCARPAAGEMTFHPRGVQKQFPDDDDLVAMRAESYCGIPLFDSRGRLTGHLALLDDKPMEQNLCELPEFPIFASRAAIELERKQAAESLQALVEGTAASVGKAFFPALVKHLSKALSVRHAFVSELVEEAPTRLRSLAFWKSGAEAENFEYESAGTPCELVIRSGLYHCPEGVQREFPTDEDLASLEAESYLGVLLEDSSGRPIGHLCVLDERPLRDARRAVSVMRIFAARAAAELERLRTENTLRRTQFAIDHSSDSVFWVRRDASFAYVNHEAARLLGYDRKELLSLSVGDVDPDHSPEDWPEKFERIKAAGSLRWEGRHRTRDGRMIPAEVTANYVRYGEREFLCAFCRDITERRRAEQALRESEERLKQITQNSPDVFWLTDTTQLKVLYVSPAYEKLWGRRVEALQANPTDWLEGIHPDDRDRIVNAFIAARAGAGFHEEYRVVRPDGTVRWVRDDGFGIRDETGRVHRMAGIASDVTQRHEMQKQLQQLQDDLARAHRLSTVGEMTAAIAHELNQPMTAIDNYAGACRQFLSAARIDRERLIELVDRLAEQAVRGGDIIRRVRGFLQGREPRRSTADPNELIRQITPLVEAEATHAGVAYATDLALDLPRIHADALQVQQVIVNLVRNAIDAAAEISDVSHRSVTLRTVRQGNDEVEISVEDTGSGISQSDMDRVFEAFYSTKPTGMGMGLAISKTIIDVHNGRIAVRSTPGQGTTFTVVLPCATR